MISTPVTSTSGRGRGWAAGLARPHTWLCRHCDMVGDYHLERDSQLRRAESLDRRDEIDRLVTFKEWLRTYEWDTDPRHQADDHALADRAPADADQAGDGWGYGWAGHTDRDPVDDSAGDAVGDARRAVDAIPDPVCDLAPGDGWSAPRTPAADEDERTEDDAVAGAGSGWRWAS